MSSKEQLTKSMRVDEIKLIKIKLASPEEILSWSHGEVLKPETINYRTQRSEKDGLFCERIFGPEKDFECYCGKYKRIRYKGIICDKCGVEVTRSSVRRERMGHIKLAAPCSHIWFLRGVPSRMGIFFDIPMQSLEKVIYFAAYIITRVDKEQKKKVQEEIEKEFKRKLKSAKSKKEKETLKEAKSKSIEELNKIQENAVLSEIDYRELSLKYGEIFEAGTGAETLRSILSEFNLEEIEKDLKAKLKLEPQPPLKRRILRRLKLVKSFIENNLRPEWMFLTVLPVIPPDLRPMVQLDGGRYASSDLNDLYRRVINRNNRLKHLFEIKAPEVIIRNEKRMLQEAVDALIDNSARKSQTTTASTGGRRLLKSLADMLKGKQGRFRQNLLGKRVDYSGRSVIVIGPEIKLHQAGIPKKMALELFKPFVIRELIKKGLAFNVRGASRLIESASNEVWETLEEIINDKYVLLNRAPTLHRLGIQAFQPILIEGEAVQIHPLVCAAFNADFDGDQMAVHLPLSEEAQQEAREIMLSSLNLLKPATGLPIVDPIRDIILGCYWLTRIEESSQAKEKIFSSKEEAIISCQLGYIDLRAKIKVLADSLGKKIEKQKVRQKYIETSVGRLIFNETLPEDFPFQNEIMGKKQLGNLTAELIDKYPIERVPEILDRIKDLGFEYSTLSGISWGLDDLQVPDEKRKLIEKAEKEVEEIRGYYLKGLLTPQERRVKSIEVWRKVTEEIERLVPQTLFKFSPSVFSIIDAGARGSWSQPVQMAGMKGLVVNPTGQTIELPVKSSFKEGFNVLEYFISTHGARKGASDTALRTATAGYLTRRLVDVVQDIIIREEDCQDKEGIILDKSQAQEIGQDFAEKIVGRISLQNLRILTPDKKGEILIKEGEIINKISAKLIEKDENIQQLRVRSPLSCQTLYGVCQKCYGWDLGTNQLVKLGEAVGIVAAQAIGEPGTQLTMRTFHTGGVARGGDITQGLPRVQEIFEVRPPLRKAIISSVKGKIMEIKEMDKQKIIKIKVYPQVDPVELKRSKKGPKAIKNLKSKKEEIKEEVIPFGMGICVERGDEIEKGTPLTDGNIDLKELYHLAGLETTQKYIEKEVQKIYLSHGAQIHSKHLEIIIRQMFSRVKIKEAGDTKFVPGEIVERDKFLEVNRNLKRENKTPAKGQRILLGISKVALTCDSFLSAASFQETSRVLIRAAIEAKIDNLRGLKENVIIGKLIPAGTGFRKEFQSESEIEATVEPKE